MDALKELRLPKNTSALTSMISTSNNLEVLDIGVTSTIGMALNGPTYVKLTYLIMRNTSQVVTLSGSPVFRANSPIANEAGKIFVPRAMVDSYKADATWGTYASIIEARFR